MKFITLITGILLGANAMGQTVTNSQTKEVITIGGGCFWCTEAVFEQLKGVEKVESGYSGGALPNPTYEQVSSGDTGHAEVSQITFDPKVISRKTILEVFFTVHNPTTLDRQGNDVIRNTSGRTVNSPIARLSSPRKLRSFASTFGTSSKTTETCCSGVSKLEQLQLPSRNDTRE